MTNFSVERLGLGSGMSLFYKIDTKYFEHFCVGRAPGLSIKLHSPEEVPSFNQDYITLQLNEIDLISIKPKMTKISKSLEDAAPNL